MFNRKNFLSLLILAASSCASPDESNTDPAPKDDDNGPTHGSLVVGRTEVEIVRPSDGAQAEARIFINNNNVRIVNGGVVAPTNFTCGTTGAITFDLEPGQYFLRVERWMDGIQLSKSYDNPITIKKGECVKRYM